PRWPSPLIIGLTNISVFLGRLLVNLANIVVPHLADDICRYDIPEYDYSEYFYFVPTNSVL
ncbi:hypothetical protein, partial [Halorubrum ezzemoulense]|uniref:hypothetical protein n=1 Tax=Halorubrum ezzemoulense TaxID=337243 RepID=UPI00232A9CC3